MAEMEVQRPASPPRRQRACLNCCKAKARCHFQDENIGRYCDRCHRLSIECLAQTAKSLRKPRQLKPFTSRVASLEQKIDGIVSLLASNHSPGPQGSIQHFPQTAGGSPEYAHQSIPTPGNSSRGSSVHVGQESAPVSSTSPYGQPQPPHQQPPQRPAAPASPGYSLSWEQAGVAVDEFRTNFMPNFPFVLIGSEITPQELYGQKPFLFRVILLIATTLSPSRKKAMKRNVMAYLGHHLLVLEERDLDLLQGLLVFIAWADMPFYMDRQITHLTSLAVGYAHNLGLTRLPPSLCTGWLETGEAADAEQAMYTRNEAGFAALHRTHDFDEQRAYLGCYYLQSVNSAQFCRRNSFKSPYVDTCCGCLTQLPGSYHDFILEKLVRLQQVVDKIADGFPVGNSADKRQKYTYLIIDEMRPLRAQLDGIAEAVERVHPQCSAFWLHYNYALVRLYEPAAYLGDPPGDTSLYRCQCLHYCLQAAKSYFTTLFTLPTEGFRHRTFVSFAELVSVIIAASRLLLLDADDWSLEIARQTLDFSWVMGELINQLGAVRILERQKLSQAGAADEELDPAKDKDNVWRKYIDKIACIKGWYESRVAVPGPFAPTMNDFEAFQVDWSTFDTDGNQFLLGLLGNDSWNFNF